MAANSLAEQIVQDIVSAIEGIQVDAVATFKKVERKKLGFDELSSVPSTLLPYAAVTVGLPDATPKISGRIRAVVDKFQSILTVSVTVYGMDNTDPDVTILSLADDLWVAIYSDPGRNGLALHTSVLPELETGIFDPYYAFTMDVEVVYVHDRTSI